MPTNGTQTDPEATAPVELSDIGIEAIESKRSERTTMHRAGIAAIVFVACAAAFLAWRLLDSAEQPEPEPKSTTEPAAPAPAMNTDAPRRGIPR
jgi:hypothetical protein